MIIGLAAEADDNIIMLANKNKYDPGSTSNALIRESSSKQWCADLNNLLVHIFCTQDR
jgi:hypothetical protein